MKTNENEDDDEKENEESFKYRVYRKNTNLNEDHVREKFFSFIGKQQITTGPFLKLKKARFLMSHVLNIRK